ncbi:chorismate synthase [[Clostridium] leptum]|uniref:Chorismate synthase n=36 Tax=Bacteria TaxID=2 RepID=A0A412AXG3_9FIRM|nr:chorismate synthase [[Clostridium] leptum]
MTNTPKNDRSTRRPDCVTEIRIGNSVLVVSGYFKQDTTATAADKMLKVLEAEAATQKSAILRDVKKQKGLYSQPRRVV